MDRILIATAEDEHRTSVVRLLQEHPHWGLRTARSGREALETLSAERVDLLLTDAELPDLSSADFLAEVRRRCPALPVVLMTAKGPRKGGPSEGPPKGANEALVRALRLGAASYVPRSARARDLLSTVSRVLSLCGRSRLAPELFACRESTQTTFVLRNDTELFQPVISYVQDELERFHDCQPSERVNAGIALEEALLNARVHGNLEIGPEVREQGLAAYEKRIAERSQLAPFKDRRITITCAFSKEEARIRIVDEGPGFDVTSLPDPSSPENRWRSGGRGLLLIRSFMDEVHFNETGNEIVMVKKATRQSLSTEEA